MVCTTLSSLPETKRNTERDSERERERERERKGWREMEEGVVTVSLILYCLSWRITVSAGQCSTEWLEHTHAYTPVSLLSVLVSYLFFFFLLHLFPPLFQLYRAVCRNSSPILVYCQKSFSPSCAYWTFNDKRSGRGHWHMVWHPIEEAVYRGACVLCVWVMFQFNNHNTAPSLWCIVHEWDSINQFNVLQSINSMFFHERIEGKKQLLQFQTIITYSIWHNITVNPQFSKACAACGRIDSYMKYSYIFTVCTSCTVLYWILTE